MHPIQIVQLWWTEGYRKRFPKWELVWDLTSLSEAFLRDFLAEFHQARQLKQLSLRTNARRLI